MDKSIASMLERSLESLDLKIDQPQLTSLVSYVQEIELWNPKYKLVAADRNGLITRHIMDSLAPVSLLRELTAEYSSPGTLQIADVGSGNGMPGIPLAIIMADMHFTLIERSGRRAGFLRNAITVSGISSRVDVLEQDLHEVRDSFDILVFRAFRPLPDCIRDLDAVLAPGGTMFAYKSRKDVLESELQAVNSLPLRYETKQIEYRVPGLDAERRICLLRRSDGRITG